jgi:hypothetical protein
MSVTQAKRWLGFTRVQSFEAIDTAKLLVALANDDYVEVMHPSDNGCAIVRN